MCAHFAHMTENKINFGIRLSKKLTDKLDNIVSESPELNTTRSELIDALIEAFFSSKFNHAEKGKSFIMTKRKNESLNK